MFTFQCTTDTGEVHLVNDIGYAEAEEQCELLYACVVFVIIRLGGAA